MSIRIRPPAGTGGCLCGAIAYEMATPPVRSTICYCKFCQRATGSAMMILPVLAKSDFALTRGSPQVHTHISEGSGKAIHMHFCATCSSKLYVTLERFPDAVGLYVGSLDDPSLVPLDPDHARQIFVSSARPGTVLMAGIPTFAQHAMDLDGTPNVPIVLDRPLAVEDVDFD